MKKDLFHLTESGVFSRLGDYLCGNEKALPFSIHCSGIGDFGKTEVQSRALTRTLVWHDSKGLLEVTVRLDFDPAGKILDRRDTLKNTGKKPLVLRRWLAAFPFQPGNYEVYTQRSAGGRENGDPAWTPLNCGALQIYSREGRCNEGATPFAALRDNYTKHALAFHVCPLGDWMLRFASRSTCGALPSPTVEAGISDDRLELELAPGEVWDAPEIFVQILPDREAYSGTAQLHRFLNRRFPARPGHFPVVYNTWLDRMDILEVPRLEKQLDAAKRCGCEVFVVDYGWYEDNRQFCRVDDWDECKDRAFYGRMTEFADKVRKAGLGFGFWIEMEIFSKESKVAGKHPDWFFPSSEEGCVCPKTWLPEVEDYLVESLSRTINRYKAVYVKNDMNHSPGYEPSHLWRFQKGLFRVMARLRKKHPEVTFENCSGGSQRMSAGGMMEAFDNHFVSDNACPLENIRMFQNNILRFVPGRIYHWYVGMQNLPAKKKEAADRPKSLIGDTEELIANAVYQPVSTTWFRFQTEDLDFGLLANMTSQIGYSCDLASFSPENLKKIAHYNVFYKKYRNALLRAEARLITQPESFDSPRGWIVFQLTDPVTDTHFVYAFHSVCDLDSARIFHLSALKEEGKYKVTEYFPEETRKSVTISGGQMMEDGLKIQLPLHTCLGFQGKLILIQPV